MTVADSGPARAAHASVTVTGRDGAAITVAFVGPWTVLSQRPSVADILAQVSGTAGRDAVAHLILDGSGLTDWDSQFLVVLTKLLAELKQRNMASDTTGLPDGARRLLALVAAAPGVAQESVKVEQPSLSERTGNTASEVAGSFLAFIDFIGALAVAFGRLLRRRAKFPLSDFAVILQDTGLRALSIVSLIAVLVGLIIAFVGSVQLNRFGAGVFTADMVAIAMLREMGALMTAIIMAGRTGAAFAAELATMQVNEEIDALATLGIDPMEYLVLPRLLALTLMMPLLCLYADFMGILGGAVIGITMMDIPPLAYWSRTKAALDFTNLSIGVVKAGVFGALIGLAGCMCGLSAERSAAAVGIATTAAVVLAIVMLVVCDGIFAVVLNVLRL